MTHTNRSGIAAVLAALVVCVLGGCNLPAYINIPSQNSDVAWSDPNLAIVRNVQVASIQHVAEKYLAGQRFQIILPDGSNVKTYDDVAAAVGAQAVSPVDGFDAQMMSVEVATVQVRGMEGKVDLLFPSDPNDMRSSRTKVTVTLENDIPGGWQVQHARVWKHLDVPLMLSDDRIPLRVIPPVGPVQKMEEDGQGSDGAAEADNADESEGDGEGRDADDDHADAMDGK